MADENEGGIVKKCKKRKCEEGGGSAWEIAYGDFMTSMMAFFLVMWLIAATNVKQRKILSTYFTNPGATSLTEGSTQMPTKGVFDVGSRSLTLSTKIPEMPLPTIENQKNVHGKGLIPKILKDRGGSINKNKNILNLHTAMTKIEQEILKNKELLKYKNQIKMDVTEKGLRIVMFDKNEKPMFAPGSAELEPYAKQVLAIVAKQLRSVSNKIAIEGYTDSTVYASNGVSNWELSSMRANAARRELEKNGIAHDRFDSVTGYADTRPVPGTNPQDAVNRRVVIIVKKL